MREIKRTVKTAVLSQPTEIERLAAELIRLRQIEADTDLAERTISATVGGSIGRARNGMNRKTLFMTTREEASRRRRTIEDYFLTLSATTNDDADALQSRALAVANKIGLKGVNLANLLSTMSNIRLAQERHDDELQLLEQAIQAVEQTEGTGHAKLVSLLPGLALAEQRRRNFAIAEAHLVRALEISKSEYGPSHTETGNIRALLGLLAVEQGQYDEATTHYSAAAEILTRNDNLKSKALGSLLLDYARALTEQGDVGSAETKLKMAIGIIPMPLVPAQC